MGKWQISEDLTNPHPRTKLLCDKEAMPTIFTKPRLECVGNREGCVIHRGDCPVSEVDHILS